MVVEEFELDSAPCGLGQLTQGHAGKQIVYAPKQDVVHKPASLVKGGNRVGIGHELGKQKSHFLYLCELPVDGIYWFSQWRANSHHDC